MEARARVFRGHHIRLIATFYGVSALMSGLKATLRPPVKKTRAPAAPKLTARYLDGGLSSFCRLLLDPAPTVWRRGAFTAAQAYCCHMRSGRSGLTLPPRLNSPDLSDVTV